MEEIIKDKIFQFYYKKIYGLKSNFHSFKTFSDKDKVEFLINLYLYISNSNIKINANEHLINNISKEKENIEDIKNESLMNDSFYEENYNRIMNEFNDILNRYNKYSDEQLKKNNNYLNSNNNEKFLSPSNNKYEENKNENIISNNNIKDSLIIDEGLKDCKNNKKIIKNANNNQSLQNKDEYNNENNKVIFSNIFDKENINDNKLIIKSCPNFDEYNLINNSNNKIFERDLIHNQTITEKSKIYLKEFKNENIIEKLIKCPQNKNISLDCSEANKLALVIINLMETKNDLENEIEKERKKNEKRLDKLRIDFDRQKQITKSKYEKFELNLLDTLNQLKKEIDLEKDFIDDNINSYNLWDKVIIENQRTKEIRDNIIKKLESLKK